VLTRENQSSVQEAFTEWKKSRQFPKWEVPKREKVAQSFLQKLRSSLETGSRIALARVTTNQTRWR